MSEPNVQCADAQAEQVLALLAGKMVACLHAVPASVHDGTFDEIECSECFGTGQRPKYPRLVEPCTGLYGNEGDRHGGAGCGFCGGSGWLPIPLAEVAGAALVTAQEQLGCWVWLRYDHDGHAQLPELAVTWRATLERLRLTSDSKAMRGNLYAPGIGATPELALLLALAAADKANEAV